MNSPIMGCATGSLVGHGAHPTKTYQHYAGYDPDTEQYRPLQDKRNVTLTMVCRMPDRRSNVAHVDFAHQFMHLPPRPDWVARFCSAIRQFAAAKGAVHGEPKRFVPVTASGCWLAQRQRRP